MVFSVFSVLLLTESAARSISDERERDTWPGLRMTSLNGREVLRAKVIGSVWKLRAVLALPVGLWSVGLVAGSVHPLGFLAALVVLIVSTGFIAIMGTTLSLWSSDRHQANERFLLVVIPLMFWGLLPRVLPPGTSSVLLGAASLPLLLWLSLWSYNDVAAALRSGAFPQLALLAIDSGEGALAALGTCLAGLVGAAVGAAGLLFRTAARRYDAAAGRKRPRSGANPDRSGRDIL